MIKGLNPEEMMTSRTGKMDRTEGATTDMIEGTTIGNDHEAMDFNLETEAGVLVKETETTIVRDSLSRRTGIDMTGETEMEETEGAGTEIETETTDAETGDYILGVFTI